MVYDRGNQWLTPGCLDGNQASTPPPSFPSLCFQLILVVLLLFIFFFLFFATVDFVWYG